MAAGLTLALHRIAVVMCGSVGNSDASVAGKSRHGRAIDEGLQAVFVSGQDAKRF